ncbi:MAG: T9SS type A sorting domain-containing protein, partial [Planctomycetes bacterium]|nr:T9SS type A sorting domain-containing protein [Planctomycetota bacterium]
YNCPQLYYGEITPFYGGPNDLESNPMYLEPAEFDYHLQSNSPCIDAGDPDFDYSNEPEPNGGRINIGAYGNTEQAAPSDQISLDHVNSGDVSVFHILYQNYPNPFRNLTTISFSIKSDGPVSLSIYNMAGQKIKILIAAEMPRGIHTADWNGLDENQRTVNNGVYFYRLKTNNFSGTKRMLLVR